MLPDHQETARPTKQGLFCGVTRRYEAKNRGLADPVASLGTELQDSPDEVKAIRSSSVMTVSLDSCLSHRAARPPHPTRPYMPCSKKFINPNILEARPARRVLDPSAWRMRSSILENSLSLRLHTPQIGRKTGHGPGLRRYLSRTWLASFHPKRPCQAIR